MVTRSNKFSLSPHKLSTVISDEGSEDQLDSPSIIAIGQNNDNFTNRKATTNESLTTIEDISSRSGATETNRTNRQNYDIEGEGLILHNQVRDPKVFAKITKLFEEDKRKAGEINEKRKRRKLQVSVEYKKCDSNSKENNISNSTQRFSSVKRSNDIENNEYKMSLTCGNPISIIQDLNFEEIPLQNNLNNNNTSNTTICGTTRKENKQNSSRIIKDNEQIKVIELKQKILLLESSNSQLQNNLTKITKELEKSNTRSALLESENFELVKQFDNISNIPAIPKIDMGTSTIENFDQNPSDLIQKLEIGIQTKIKEFAIKNIQTEPTCWQQLIEKMKEELAAQNITLTNYEKTKINYTGTIENQQKIIDKLESEKIIENKQRKALQSELNLLKTDLEKHKKLLNELKEFKQKSEKSKEEIEKLQTELKTLQVQTDSNTELKYYKNMALESSEKLQQINLKIEEIQEESHKKTHKIKEVRKERDLLKIEILKLKQVFSEKCDNYKEIRNRLYKKIKQKDEIIGKLQTELENCCANSEIKKFARDLISDSEKSNNPSTKMLINMTEENHKDLSRLLKIDLEDENQYDFDKRYTEEHRSKSFYSDDTTAILDAYGNSRHGISGGTNNTSGSLIDSDKQKKSVNEYEPISYKVSRSRKSMLPAKAKDTSNIISNTEVNFMMFY